MSQTHVSSRHRRGFSLVELLVVIIIILALIAILMPALSAIRLSAKKASSRSQITALSGAIVEYHLTFGDFPGWESDAALADAANSEQMTSTENLVVSLMGRVETGGSATFTLPASTHPVNLDKVGVGPAVYPPGTSSFTVANQIRAYGAFYTPKPGELGAVQGTRGTQNDLPEFLDIGSAGVPILYLRAVSPDPNAASLPVPVDATGTTSAYFLRHTVRDYVEAPALQAFNGDVFDQERFSGLSLNGSTNGAAGANNNLAWIVTNPTLSNVTVGNRVTANNDDDIIGGRYYLIAPGPDGIYFNLQQQTTVVGSRPDIDSYEKLRKFDDQVVSGG